MKKIVLIIILLRTSLLISQVEIQVGGMFGMSSSPSFKEFMEYYNVENQSAISKPLDKGSFNYGTNLQFSLQIMNMYTAVGYANAMNTTNAVFVNGTERVINFNSKYYNILIGYINDDSDNSEFAIYSGFVVNDYIMSSYIKYKTKDRDYIAGAVGGVYQTQGFGIPLIGHYSRRITDQFWLYGKCQLQVISATKFGVYDYMNLSKQIKDDSKRVLFELGVQFKIG